MGVVVSTLSSIRNLLLHTELAASLHCAQSPPENAQLTMNPRLPFGVVIGVFPVAQPARNSTTTVAAIAVLIMGEPRFFGRQVTFVNRSMVMAMMNIRIVRVDVPEGLVTVRVCMGLGAVPLEVMLVLMVRVMCVCMRVGRRRMLVLMVV